jgi:hypothetical protein
MQPFQTIQSRVVCSNRATGFYKFRRCPVGTRKCSEPDAQAAAIQGHDWPEQWASSTPSSNVPPATPGSIDRSTSLFAAASPDLARTGAANSRASGSAFTPIAAFGYLRAWAFQCTQKLVILAPFGKSVMLDDHNGRRS